MKLPRASGILLHPTSLPGRFGVGEIGPEARRFASYLRAAGQTVWQVLPLGPTGYGDSPYQCFSAFAGNPLLISFDDLMGEGLLTKADIEGAPAFPPTQADYGQVIEFKLPLLDQAFEVFEREGSLERRQAFDSFCERHRAWLDDYALFTAVKAQHGGVAWPEWEPGIAMREPGALESWRERCARAMASCKFQQFIFFEQWTRLKQVCREHDVLVMGDVPIFVAHDSADVWAHPELFQLTADGRPAFKAGVPPDYFSATGQCWGNPLYRWPMLERTGFAWWVERLRHTLQTVDWVRLDHFRGFEAYWEIPGEDETAEHGRWVRGPGRALFQALQETLGELPIIAENLGVITPEVEELRHEFGFPGMGILQFAFGTDPQGSTFLPHNYDSDLVVYTGTHDNDTTVGWWTGSGKGDSTRTPEEIEAEREHCRRYTGANGLEIHWAFIRTLLGSVAGMAIIPLQDVLGLGNEARMNLPARESGNWRWRFTWDQLTDADRDRLRDLAVIYGRFAPPARTPVIESDAHGEVAGPLTAGGFAPSTGSAESDGA